MKDIVLAIIIGIVAGTIDILPMIKMKQDKNSIVSAFVFYLIVPFMIFGTSLFGMPWWLEGGIITLAMALPIIILVMKEDKKAAAPMIVMSVVLGTAIGITGHLLNISL
jgi:predicted permease